MFFFHCVWVLGTAGGGGFTNCLCGFSPKQLKIQSFRNLFLITQNDHPRYSEHVLGRIYVSFTLFGNWVQGGGGGQGIGTQPAYALFPTYTAQKSKFPKLIFLKL